LWGSKTTNDKGKKLEDFLSQEGEGKKQMGDWNQSLEFMKIVLDPHIINDCGLRAAIFQRYIITFLNEILGDKIRLGEKL
jgi:phosphoserine phosphatase